ncbi:TPA: hypothetical protein HA219_01335 [Candidatus Woesearchaeota archaeon]|nr:hypothetical protein [Candidatus Woesearchaeota archaeon]HIH39349.1 hypothetical protein [Candidatus Woesearchaeota archaeon]
MVKKPSYVGIREDGFGENKNPGSQRTEPYLWQNKYTKLIVSTGGYNVYLNRRTGEVYVHTTDYHPGTLIISKESLEKLLSDASKKE